MTISQREARKLKRRVDELEAAENLAAKLAEARSCEVVMRETLEWVSANNALPQEARERIQSTLASQPAPKQQDDALAARRYRWLRDGNAYAPEEEMVRGGDELDKLCDESMQPQPKGGEPC